MIRDRAAEVATIWARAVGREADETDIQALQVRASDELLQTSDHILEASAQLARRAGSDGGWILPLSEWEKAAASLALVGQSAQLDPASFERRILPFIHPSSALQEAALALLRARAQDKAFHLHSKDFAYTSLLDVSCVPEAIDFDPDRVENEALRLILSVSKDGAFSSTGEGHVFLSYRHGYHREEERTYVNGLSAGLDFARIRVDGHRKGSKSQGGRFFVDHRAEIQCAVCYRSLGSALLPRTVEPNKHCVS